MMLDLVLIAAGFLLLIRGADWLVVGASSLARRLGVSALVVGLTVVAFGTSAPELIVNLFSAFRGTTDIAVGNILGSNIANTLLILGASVAFVPLAVRQSTVWKEIPFSLLAALAVIVLGCDVVLGGQAQDVLSRGDGLALLLFFAIFLYYTYGISRNAAAQPTGQRVLSQGKTAAYVFGGLCLLVVGGKIIVDAAVDIASTLGVSQHLIGMTIVAVGTSLPEFATSVVAALKKQPDIAIGNIVGSNIFNIFLILGVTATIAPLPFGAKAVQDAMFVLAVTLVLFASMFVGSRHKLDRWQGAAFVGIYFAYVAYIIFRG